jgi:hypothetical protein
VGIEQTHAAVARPVATIALMQLGAWTARIEKEVR